jgi:oxygen-independent coproporphyrinogen-3 oxidase
MLPLSLYIHIPWCIRKCPYCDFNSHKSPDTLPEQNYIKALIEDLSEDLKRFTPRTIHSIFIGGGTPSLFSANAYDQLFTELKKLLPFAANIEITMEANPGSVEQQRFTDYRHLGINRLSLGIQSFNPDHLKRLGRVHDAQQAHKAIEAARTAGFDNINLDLMHGLPKQTIEQGLDDLSTALSYKPEHLSWYQLTIEPNTLFYKEKPPLPNDEEAYLLELKGLELIREAGLVRYEISAFSKSGKEAQHNLNYWLFGDYLGIGAGAHGKITQDGVVHRTKKHRQPKDYQNGTKPFLADLEYVDNKTLLFEFMLNTTRLEQPIPIALFTERTLLSEDLLNPMLRLAAAKNLIQINAATWEVTPFGRRYTNNLQELFLP